MEQESKASRRERCAEIIRGAGRVVVAFSGGIDSTLVAKVARDVLGAEAIAATAVSPSLAKADLEEACALASAIGIEHRLIESAETEKAEYQKNGPDRCYFCKDTAYDLFTALARTEGYFAVLDGTNADDTGDHRPGRRAAREHGVLSPLQEAGLTKADVREWARDLGLANWDKPANACLSSRVPFGMEVTPRKLAQIEAAESALRALGFRQCRVRHHGQVARVEIESDQMDLAFARRTEMAQVLKAAGFLYVTLDLEGFRSGSLNAALAPQQREQSGPSGA
jgi:uncharacterized protein